MHRFFAVTQWVLASFLTLGASVTADAGDLPVAIAEVYPADALNGLVFGPNLPEPLPASQLSIFVHNSSNQPLPGFSVELIVLQSGINLCPGSVLTTEILLTTETDDDGWAYFELAGGGCIHDTNLSATIKVNGVSVANYDNVKSPDFDGASGDGRVDLSDLVDFTGGFLDGSGGLCHDYDNDGAVTLSDLIIFSPAFVAPNHCP